MAATRAASAGLAVETHGLVKAFGSVRVVDGVDLVIEQGEVCALLGPNGAGKTTTIRMLATLLEPDGGTARVLGHDVVAQARQVRARVALTGQSASLDEDLTGLENLALLARLHGFRGRAPRRRARELLAAFDLAHAGTREVKLYSGGMRRRLDIAGSLVVRPDLMFLDEPTTGLDPRSRNEVWQIVRSLARAGTTVLLTTQYLEEADHLADRIAVIDRGRVVAAGTSGELKASVGRGALRVRVAEPDQRSEAARLLAQALGGEPTHGPDPAVLSFRVDDPAAVVGALQRVAAHGLTITEFSLGRPSLDEVFLALTGQAVEEVAA